MTGDTLRIAHVDAETGFSGGEVQVLLLLEGLQRRGHESLLVCPPGSGAEAAARERGLAVETVPMRGDLDLPAVLRLGRVFGRWAPDLVHLHTGRATWLGGLAARRAARPALTTRRQDKRLVAGWRSRLVYGRLVQRAVAISPAVRQRLVDGGVAPGRLSVIPSTVDPAALVPSRGPGAVRADLGVGADAPVLLVLAALVRRKGIDVLLDALARLERPPVLWVAGDGPVRAELEAQAQRLRLDGVSFLGRRADKADLLAACDLFVLPSRLEGLGVAALEAMAAGRALVASRVGGLGEAVVHGKTGLLVPPEDPVALSEAIATLVADPAARAAFGAAGRERVLERYHPDRMVDAYVDLYRDLLAPAGP